MVTLGMEYECNALIMAMRRWKVLLNQAHSFLDLMILLISITLHLNSSVQRLGVPPPKAFACQPHTNLWRLSQLKSRHCPADSCRGYLRR